MLTLLNDKDREIIEMYYFNDCTLRTIGYKLDMNDSYVSRRKAYIINKLLPFAKKHNLV